MIRPPPRSPLFPYAPLFRSGVARVGGIVRGHRRDGLLAAGQRRRQADAVDRADRLQRFRAGGADIPGISYRDRKSTRLNSSHSQISYAVFCLKKKHLQTPLRGCIILPRIVLKLSWLGGKIPAEVFVPYASATPCLTHLPRAQAIALPQQQTPG